jgi:hypothetical protein
VAQSALKNYFIMGILSRDLSLLSLPIYLKQEAAQSDASVVIRGKEAKHHKKINNSIKILGLLAITCRVDMRNEETITPTSEEDS